MLIYCSEIRAVVNVDNLGMTSLNILFVNDELKVWCISCKSMGMVLQV